MSQKRAKHAKYKVILPFEHDINQPSYLIKFDIDQVWTQLPLFLVWL
jgi:hypothetical protein